MSPTILLALIGIIATGQDAPTPLEVRVPDRTDPVSFANEVLDLLDASCIGCHSSALAENDLNLEDLPAMLKGGKSGQALVPGKADDSLLFRMAAHRIDPVMPPADKPELEPLTPEQLGLLKLWIDQGARDDSAEAAGDPSVSLTLGNLPPGLHPILALDLASTGDRLAVGRANVVQLYEPETGVEIVRLGGHQDLIQSIRFSRDGSTLAAGSYQIVTLWNTPSGRPESTYNGHAEAVTAVAATPDGQRFATGSTDRTIRLWQPAGEQPLRQLDASAPVHGLALTPDGTRLAAACADGHVRLWNAEDGTLLHDLTGGAGEARAVAFGPDPHRLAAGFDDGSIHTWDLPDDPAAPVAPGRPLAGAVGPTLGVAFAGPDRIAATGRDGHLRLWDWSDGQPKLDLSVHAQPILALAASPDGSRLITGSEDGTARLINPIDGSIGPPLTGHLGPVRGVAFAPDGLHFATAGHEGAVKLWAVDPSRGLVAFAHKNPDQDAAQPLRAVAFAGPSRLVSGSDDHSARSWTFEGDWRPGRTLGPHQFRVLALDFNPEGTVLAAGGGEPSRSGEIKLWEVASGELLKSIDDRHTDTVFALRFSPDGTRLASAGADKFLKVSLMPKGELQRTFEGHTHHVLAVDWKQDGKQLVTGGADNVAKVWDLDTGEQLRTMQAAGNQVTGLRWIPGQPSMAGSSGDRQVHLWNAENGQVQKRLTGPTDYLYAVAASADGRRVAAAGEEGAIYLWRVDNGQLLRKIEAPGDLADPARRLSASGD